MNDSCVVKVKRGQVRGRMLARAGLCPTFVTTDTSDITQAEFETEFSVSIIATLTTILIFFEWKSYSCIFVMETLHISIYSMIDFSHPNGNFGQPTISENSRHLLCIQAVTLGQDNYPEENIILFIANYNCNQLDHYVPFDLSTIWLFD